MSNDNLQVMDATVKSIVDLMQGRLNINTDALLAIENANAIDMVPDDVKKMREVQATALRAVIREIKEEIAIVKAMYPNA